MLPQRFSEVGDCCRAGRRLACDQGWSDLSLEEFIKSLRSEGRSSPGGFTWHEFWLELSKASRFPGDEPPMPMILGGSGASNDHKLAQLRAQLIWAEQHGRLADSIELLKAIPPERWNTGSDLNWYRDSYPTGHIGWTCDPKPKLARDQASALIRLLRRNWSDVAGERLCAVTYPVRFSGQKGRRLVVESVIGSHPPWGSWQHISQNSQRASFAALRASVNEALAPHAVDHIDFLERVQPKASGVSKCHTGRG